ncbi:enoyl-[acyl-carrier protein] reductase II [Desulfitispora alkaliphila]|uniref:enoyl-[acyl-carrier-protein] reductase FabK n=1 Tax=Desulfitispora alkaliphila TaxID=622674 RepID=UPI003D1E2D54
MRTEICELLNIEYPIIQGGMAWVSTGELAAAVSEAGGLGVIAAGNAPAEWVATEIKKVKEKTNKPFGINVMLLSPHVQEVMDIVLKEKVPVVTTGAGNPGKYIEDLKAIGSKVIPVVASVALAKRLEKQGVDALIAEGLEGGGHVGDITTMALVPQIVDAVKIPVIAAGGVFDGRGAVAAMVLGAKGVQMGTRFMCAEECTVHPAVKQLVIKSKDRDTVVTGRPTGHPVRILKNKLARELDALERSGAEPAEFEKLGTGKLRNAMVDGDVKYGSVMAGQVAAMVKGEETAEQIITSVVEEVNRIIDNFPKQINK